MSSSSPGLASPGGGEHQRLYDRRRQPVHFDNMPQPARQAAGIRIGRRQSNAGPAGTVLALMSVFHAVQRVRGQYPQHFTLGQAIALEQGTPPGTFGEISGGVTFRTGNARGLRPRRGRFRRQPRRRQGRAGVRGSASECRSFRCRGRPRPAVQNFGFEVRVRPGGATTPGSRPTRSTFWARNDCWCPTVDPAEARQRADRPPLIRMASFAAVSTATLAGSISCARRFRHHRGATRQGRSAAATPNWRSPVPSREALEAWAVAHPDEKLGRAQLPS